MADNEPKYELKSVRMLRGTEPKTRTRLENDGWEFVSQNQGPLLRTEMTFRRPKPRRPWQPWIVGVSVFAVVAIIIAVNAIREEDDRSGAAASSSASLTPSEQPSEQPTAQPPQASDPSELDEATAVTDTEVIEGFRGFLDERSAAGVVLARTATDVTFSNRLLRVTFDPAAGGIDDAFFDQLNPYDNLATFVAAPIAFDDDLGNRLRPAVDAIETVHIDGRSLGTLDRNGILALNDLEQ